MIYDDEYNRSIAIELFNDLIASFEVRLKEFDNAIDPIISQLDTIHSKAFEKYLIAYQEFCESNEDGGLFFDDFTEGRILALAEMKIIYLYKCIEIQFRCILNHINSRKGNTNKLHEDMESEFLKIIEIEGWKEINELRIVNNKIKHTISRNEFLCATKDIKEFSGLKSRNAQSEEFLLFYDRINPKILIFFNQFYKKYHIQLFD